MRRWTGDSLPLVAPILVHQWLAMELPGVRYHIQKITLQGFDSMQFEANITVSTTHLLTFDQKAADLWWER
jgi:hypothetical protein